MKPNAEPLNLYVSNLNECLLQFKLGSEEQRINTLKCVEMLAYAGGNSFEQVNISDFQTLISHVVRFINLASTQRSDNPEYLRRGFEGKGKLKTTSDSLRSNARCLLPGWIRFARSYFQERCYETTRVMHGRQERRAVKVCLVRHLLSLGQELRAIQVLLQE
jgi:hypothetical protein